MAKPNTTALVAPPDRDVKWHTMSAGDTLARLNTRLIDGLTSAEAAARLEKYGFALPDCSALLLFCVTFQEVVTPQVGVDCFRIVEGCKPRSRWNEPRRRLHAAHHGELADDSTVR